MKPKLRRFWFHLNKPKTRVAGFPVWSFHFRGKCYIANKISCFVPVQTKANKRQPWAVVQGMAAQVSINADLEDTAEITVHGTPVL